MQTRKLFVLEDNRPLSNGIERLCERLGGWTVELARSIAQAREKCANGPFDAALVDLMVPDSNEDLELVDDWLAERDNYAYKVVNLQADRDSEKMRTEILQEMEWLDTRIRELVNETGGLEFLQTAEAGALKLPNVRFAVFSAIPKYGYKKEGRDDFENVRRAIEPNTIEKWFEKPVSLPIVKAWLQHVESAARC